MSENSLLSIAEGGGYPPLRWVHAYLTALLTNYTKPALHPGRKGSRLFFEKSYPISRLGTSTKQRQLSHLSAERDSREPW